MGRELPQSTVSDAFTVATPIHSDGRGWLAKLLMDSQLPTDSSFGEIYAVCAFPGQERGGHFHKLTNEWFFVLAGAARLHLTDGSGGSASFRLDAGAPQGVCVPAGIWHKFENVGEANALILAFADKEYDPDNTDTYADQPDGH